jgi:cysteine synthase A
MEFPKDVRRQKLFASVVEAIGHTPLVELARMTRNLDSRILVKLEYLNPGFSKKDRIARQIIEDAETDRTLAPGQTVVELTSGNTGTGLAIVCAAAVISLSSSRIRLSHQKVLLDS